MSVQPKNASQPGIYTPAPLPEMRAAVMSSANMGNLLFHMHSVHFKPILFRKEETSLQFYEHFVVATVTDRLWCFPKKSHIMVIPRFKVVDADFTLGPKRISKVLWFWLTAAILLILFGALLGGCKKCEGSYYYSSSSCDNSGACACLVIGILILLIPVPITLLIPCFFKLHHVYLDVKANPKEHRKGFVSYDYCFKKLGLDDATDNKAAFDEFIVLDYVYGSYAKMGNDVMTEAHLLSHFHHVNLAKEIAPHHADQSIRELALQEEGLFQRKRTVQL